MYNIKHRYVTVMTHSPELLFFKIIMPLVLTHQAYIPVITTAQIKIPSNIEYHRLNILSIEIQRRDVIMGIMRSRLRLLKAF